MGKVKGTLRCCTQANNAGFVETVTKFKLLCNFMNMIYSTVGCSRMCHSDMKEIPLVLKQDKIFSVVENSFTEHMDFFKSEKKTKN